MKIISVIGARPQFIKAAAISREMNKRSDIRHLILHTGQHFDKNMSDVFFEQIEIPKPDYNLQIHSLSHGAMTGRMLEAVEGILIDESPDVVIVYGDTDSTLAGALAAAKLRLKVAHVEAGLRSHNMDMPEEANRILTDRISDLLLCPTKTAVANLEKEGFRDFPCRVVRCGDVMYDASLHYREFSNRYSRIVGTVAVGAFVLCTIHRAENTDNAEKLRSIFDGLNKIAQDIPVILPLHPRTRQVIEANGISARVTVLEPVGYLDMMELLKNCELVITDSGGLQKEAFFFRKGCITLRDETEWEELVEHGCNVLAGSDARRIYTAFTGMMSSVMQFDEGLYGDGTASRQIVDELRKCIADSRQSAIVPHALSTRRTRSSKLPSPPPNRRQHVVERH